MTHESGAKKSQQSNLSSVPYQQGDDFIRDYIEYTSLTPTAEIFRKWVAVWGVSAALERRVWLDLSGGKLYPNLFIFLMAPPGVGKDQAINPLLGVMRKCQTLNLSPISMTGKGMLDTLAAPSSIKEFQAPGLSGKTVYQTLNVCVPELGTLFEKQDLGFLSIINELYNCGAEFREKIRSRDEELHIRNPHMTLLGGTQPNYLSSLFPPESWGMGFMARMIMVYHGETEKKSLFSSKSNIQVSEKNLLAQFNKMQEISGPITVTEEAQSLIEEWHMEGSELDKPTHPKLIHYNTRRIIHALKIALILTVSKGAKQISPAEWEEAKGLLLQAEDLIPEIFKEMSNTGQKDIIDDAFYFITMLYNKNGKKPISEHRLVEFLSRHVSTNQISYIIDNMIKMKLLREEGGLNDSRPSAQRTRIRTFVPAQLNSLEL